MKYLIIPTSEIAGEIFADNAEEALCNFAFFDMDSDMHAYFKAVTEEEYETLKNEKEWKAHREHIIEFMEEVAFEDFKIPEKNARELAEDGYERYASGDYHETEYDCIEAVCNRYWEDKEFEAEFEDEEGEED